MLHAAFSTSKLLLVTAVGCGLLLGPVAAAGGEDEVEDLIRRVDKLQSRLSKLKRRQLSRFYDVRYSDEEVKNVRHQCYIALLDHVDNRSENKQRRKDLRFIQSELKKLRKGYGKLAKLSAASVAACEERRIPECDRLLNLPDGTETRYFRAEIDVLKDDAQRVQEVIKAHLEMAVKSLSACNEALSTLR